MACILGGLFRAGDRIATDGLTYPGFKTLAAMLGLRLVPIAMDEHGMVPGKPGRGLPAQRHQGPSISCPACTNPTTATIPEERRKQIAGLAEWHDLLIIEDDAYDLTNPARIPPVGDNARDRSLFIAGMSKSMAAGLRVAFVAAPKRLLKSLAQAVLNTIWMTPPLKRGNWPPCGSATARRTRC